ncbi:hypothetical protein ACFRFL_03155 [Streptomyces sp. NPDC056708]|uniref:hypothetical protein n=1 Tax=unclassified Streptomyces TaxID=2593676 RepID=UPI00368F9899
MSFEEEWAGLKANAAARMQLNGAPTSDPRPAPSDGDLVIYDDELGKIGHFAYQLHNNLKADGKHARTTTEAAGTSLASDGFEMGKALTAASKVWDEQVGTLTDSCAHISNHLDFTKASKKKDDEWVATQVSASRIADYYDVPEEDTKPSIPKAQGPIM